MHSERTVRTAMIKQKRIRRATPSTPGVVLIPLPDETYSVIDPLVDAVVFVWNAQQGSGEALRFWQTDLPHVRADYITGALNRYDLRYRPLIATLLLDVARTLLIATAPYQR
ncbi:MAG: hypothetical protein IRZ31_20115 [Thermogemmatispora sp.]|uniref:hypothetical protein n=1 Tax=Thermogemmatispora sp. TaxID=1968838 RepID=UPI002620940D|nr:hypothetical protein [Thermogemmatispora sp.]MBX5459205.1 hypothetical protein [Thermogemmatispora sp.]